MLLQVVFLFSLNLFTSLFKGLIPISFRDVPDYVSAFLNTFVPYLLVIFITVALYIAYVILVQDPDYLKAGAQLFDYCGIGFIASFMLYFIAVVSLPPFSGSSVNAALPNSVEFFILLTTVLLAVEISLLPFEVYRYLTNQEKKPVGLSTEQAE